MALLKSVLTQTPTLQQQPGRNKFNSTSTLFISDSLSAPNVDEIIRCMARRYLKIVEKGAKTCQKTYYDIFNEMIHPLSKQAPNFYRLPTEDEIYEFIKFIHEYERMDCECMIMSMAYIDRLLDSTSITMDTTNWKRIVLAACIVALKAWEDLAVFNNDFLGCFDGKVTVKDLNFLEMQFLHLIQYSVFLKASSYATYYFELKSLSTKADSSFPLVPISKEKASELEHRSQGAQKSARDLRKSLSVDNLKPITLFVPAVLS